MYKSTSLKNELDHAVDSINGLGAVLEDIKEVTVPFLNEPRFLLILKKIEKTKYNYPRNYAKIKKVL